MLKLDAISSRVQHFSAFINIHDSNCQLLVFIVLLFCFFPVPLTVKVRVADSDETDFVEVELESTSYINLVKTSCEELGVAIGDIAKVRKLPNVLVRKDKDIARMTEGQEIELVLKTTPYLANAGINFTPPTLINFSVQDGGLSDHHGNPTST